MCISINCIYLILYLHKMFLEKKNGTIKYFFKFNFYVEFNQ